MTDSIQEHYLLSATLWEGKKITNGEKNETESNKIKNAIVCIYPVKSSSLVLVIAWWMVANIYSLDRQRESEKKKERKHLHMFSFMVSSQRPTFVSARGVFGVWQCSHASLNITFKAEWLL